MGAFLHGAKGTSRLQVNPNLVVWPGDDLACFLVDERGRVGERFHLSPEAISVLRAFDLPRSLDEVFVRGSDAAPTIRECVAQGLLLPIGRRAALPAAGSSRWAGFRLGDHASCNGRHGVASLVTRRHQLGRYRIDVLDHVFEPQWLVAIHRWFFQMPYRRTDIDRRGTSQIQHWVNEFWPASRVVGAVPALAALEAMARAVAAHRRLTLKRARAYNVSYGDLPLAHRDLERGRGLTAVYFGNARWLDAWAGEMVFYDRKAEATIIVPPRPGRLVVFDSGMLHRGGAPTRECHEARYSFVMNFSIS
jgi:hypothetical protein